MPDANDPVFTVKEWLQRIDAKQDKLDEKIDRVTESMDSKADRQTVIDLTTRLTIAEQSLLQRGAAVDRNVGKIDTIFDTLDQKADRTELNGVQRLLIGALGGSAVAILAWALTVLSGVHIGHG